jgi:hypothetical protein
MKHIHPCCSEAKVGFEHRGLCKPATTMHVKMYIHDKDVHNTQINVYVASEREGEGTGACEMGQGMELGRPNAEGRELG